MSALPPVKIESDLAELDLIPTGVTFQYGINRIATCSLICVPGPKTSNAIAAGDWSIISKLSSTRRTKKITVTAIVPVANGTATGGREEKTHKISFNGYVDGFGITYSKGAVQFTANMKS